MKFKVGDVVQVVKIILKGDESLDMDVVVGDVGFVERVERSQPDDLPYHVRFPRCGEMAMMREPELELVDG